MIALILSFVVSALNLFLIGILVNVTKQLYDDKMWDKREDGIEKLYNRHSKEVLNVVREEIDVIRRVVISLEEKVLKRQPTECKM